MRLLDIPFGVHGWGGVKKWVVPSARLIHGEECTVIVYFAFLGGHVAGETARLVAERIVPKGLQLRYLLARYHTWWYLPVDMPLLVLCPMGVRVMATGLISGNRLFRGRCLRIRHTYDDSDSIASMVSCDWATRSTAIK